MGFLDKFKKNTPQEEPVNTDAYKRIVNLIDDKNKTYDALVSCIENPKAYYADNRDSYEERCLDESTDVNTIIWIGLVDGFIDNELMYELDYKDEAEEFSACVKALAGERALTVNDDWFDGDGDITVWAEILNDKWKESDYVLAAMDIDSDSYCIFLINSGSYEELVSEAKKTGHRIIDLR